MTFPAERSAQPIDGRLLLLISAEADGEPRLQVNDTTKTAQVFGVDVDGWKPGEPRSVDGTAFGYPIRSLASLPRGTYLVQAMVNRYETFTRGDGVTVKLPPDKGEGQQWARKPGNLYSTPRRVTLDPAAPQAIRLVLDQEVPPVADFAKQETKYVKYVRVRSERLSTFWGRDMYLAAWVLLPWGYDDHPDARYPLVINHGHFPSSVSGWRETPPDPNLKPDFSDRFQLSGYNRIQQELAHQFYKDWTGPGFPRVLLVEIQHPTPFYDDSYAVNSANNGPYGDAIMFELVPEIERRFRGLGQGWARFTYGGSTGGWEAMAVQMFYPDAFNGAWVACPDPIDFRHYTVVNLYDDENAYYTEGPFKRVPRPGLRNYLGHVTTTLEQMNHRELALGHQDSIGRPVGRLGVGLLAARRRRLSAADLEQADRARSTRRSPPTGASTSICRTSFSATGRRSGPKLRGKLRIYVGDMDNYYLNNAVYEVEKFLKAATPPADAVIDYGDRAEHCWNGDHTRSNAYSRLRYPQMVLPWAVERMLMTAPEGADLKSWRY